MSSDRKPLGTFHEILIEVHRDLKNRLILLVC